VVFSVFRHNLASKSASANETEEAELDNNAPSIDEIQEVTDSFCSNFPETK
jgi:hypothetical protein